MQSVDTIVIIRAIDTHCLSAPLVKAILPVQAVLPVKLHYLLRLDRS